MGVLTRAKMVLNPPEVAWNGWVPNGVGAGQEEWQGVHRERERLTVYLRFNSGALFSDSRKPE